jgi:hypothetical protein
MSKDRLLLGFAIVTLAPLSGCGDFPTQQRDSSTAAAHVRGRAPVLQPTGEAVFRRLATHVPEFGGFYMNDDGELEVRLTDLRSAPAIRAALIPILDGIATERKNPGFRHRGIAFRQAEYTFTELSVWRDAAHSHVFPLDGVVFLDLDEAWNRVTIGIRDESFRLVVEAAAMDARIPLAALRFIIVGEAIQQIGETAASSGGCTSLRGVCRPLAGGFQIGFYKDGKPQQHFCTLGFPVLFGGGQAGFVTNAHCSDDEWNLDGTLYHQPASHAPIGTEAVDPRGWGCEIFFKCRNSDANIVRTSVPVDVGFVARTLGSNNGSIQIDAERPRFMITAMSRVYGGETIHMIGRTSGWLTGRVTHTCTNFKKTWEGRWHDVLCSDVSNQNVQAGDSGSPMFLWDGVSDQITLVGIMFARTGIWDHTFFSPIHGIERDLGRVEARAPGYRTPRDSGVPGGGDCGDAGDMWIVQPC